MRKSMMGLNGSLSVLLAALTATAWLSAAPSEEPVLTVGWQKQLFLDDWVIDSTENVSRLLKEPQRWPGNSWTTGSIPPRTFRGCSRNRNAGRETR